MTTENKLLSSADDISFAFNSPEWCTFNVVIQNNLDGMQYYSLLICPAIFAAASPIWQALLNQAYQENETNEIIFKVNDSCEAECFYGLIESIHCRCIPSYIASDSVKLVRFLLISNQHQVESAVNSAVQTISCSMVSQNESYNGPSNQIIAFQVIKQLGLTNTLPVLDLLKNSAINYCFMLLSKTHDDLIIETILDYFSPIELFINDSRLLNLSPDKIILLLQDCRCKSQKEEAFCAFIYNYIVNLSGNISDLDIERIIICVRWPQVTTSYLLHLLMHLNHNASSGVFCSLIRRYAAEGLSVQCLTPLQKQNYIQKIQDELEKEKEDDSFIPNSSSSWKWKNEQITSRDSITSNELEKLRFTELIINILEVDHLNYSYWSSKVIVRNGMHFSVEINSFFDSNRVLWPEISLNRCKPFEMFENTAENSHPTLELMEEPLNYSLRIWNYTEKKWFTIFSKTDTLEIDYIETEEKVLNQIIDVSSGNYYFVFCVLCHFITFM